MKARRLFLVLTLGPLSGVAAEELGSNSTAPSPVLRATEEAARAKKAADSAAKPVYSSRAERLKARRQKQLVETTIKYDKNQDGRLDDEEHADADAASKALSERVEEFRRKKILEEAPYDSDHDGRLDRTERIAYEKDRLAKIRDEARQIYPAGVAGLEKQHKQRLDEMAAAEANRQEIFAPVDPKQFDLNKNHQLEPDERADYLKAVAERRERLRSTTPSPPNPNPTAPAKL